MPTCDLGKVSNSKGFVHGYQTINDGIEEAGSSLYPEIFLRLVGKLP